MCCIVSVFDGGILMANTGGLRCCPSVVYNVYIVRKVVKQYLEVSVKDVQTFWSTWICHSKLWNYDIFLS